MDIWLDSGKTKILSNAVEREGQSRAQEVEVAGQKVQVLRPGESVAYLGRCLCFQDAENGEVEHRIGRGGAKFAVFKGELCDHRYSLLHRNESQPTQDKKSGPTARLRTSLLASFLVPFFVFPLFPLPSFFFLLLRLPSICTHRN